MLRGFALLMLLLGASLLGCTKTDDASLEGVPDIPPGRSRVGPEAGDQSPVPDPSK